MTFTVKVSESIMRKTKNVPPKVSYRCLKSTTHNSNASLPRILLRSVFSRSGLSCASLLRSSLVQMMNAFRGLLTLCVEADLGSGLLQLESEFTDMGLEGLEPGERKSLICSRSAAPGSSLSNMFARGWRWARSWLKRMLESMTLMLRLGGRPLSSLRWSGVTDLRGRSTNRRKRRRRTRRSGFKVWI